MEKGRACTIPSGTGEGTHWRADSALEDDGSLCICSSVASPEARRLRECAAAELSSSENQSDPRPPGLHATPPSGHLWGSPPPPGRSLRIGPPRSPSRRLRREDAGERAEETATSASSLSCMHGLAAGSSIVGLRKKTWVSRARERAVREPSG